jgi:hypothetical protein
MKRRANNSGGGRTESKLFEDDFFIPFDGHLFTDMKDRRLTPTEFCVYSMLLRHLDFETGIWTGSAYWIYVGWGGQLSHRTIQDSLKRLGDKGLIKSFHRRGQRNDYAVAIHNYHVRFGKWKGCKLDASATTDPRQPFYRRECEAAPIPEHNDSEQSAQLLRNHSESTATPIARNTPEYPDVPEDSRTAKTPTTSTTGESSLIVVSVETDVDVVVAGIGSDKLNGQGQRLESEQRGVDRGRLMGAVRTIWNRLRGPVHVFCATASHVNAAVAAATEVDEDIFLTAWNYFLLTGQHELRWKSGEKYEFRAWPLEYFVTSGTLHELVERVRPFAGLAEDETLVFLVNAQQKSRTPISVTRENLAILSAFIRRWPGEDLEEHYEGQPMGTFVAEVVVPLDAELRREADAECELLRQV